LAKKEGHLTPETDEQQLTFEIHGLILALHYEARFLKTPGSVERALAGFERIVRERQPPLSAHAQSGAQASASVAVLRRGGPQRPGSTAA
jgi:hypothetical protein